MFKKNLKKTCVYIILIFFSLLFLAPFFWLLTTSVKGPEEVFLFPPKWIPTTWHFENFMKAWNLQPFNLFLKNSLIVVVLSTIGQVFSSSLVAFGFARFEFRGRNFLFMIVLATMMIPWDVTMIPLYMQFNFLGWINTLKPLIVPSYFGSAFFIFLLRQFLMGIPKDLDEAAKIDGANAFQIYWKIYLPLMKPALVLISVFNILGTWNDYLGPLIFLNDQRKYTLSLGLSQFKGMNGVDTTSMMAITTLICLPPLIMFFIAQKHIIDGVSSTGLKG
ncbi:MAG: carbohydrate ABC transporter permease [Psychrilyobacter sp.]|uniref:carbohydrate ABC transporter permease n=1 Tax=Psychrilyobacter sp. TaxID=2586924 RepID=UPI003C76B72F